MVGEILGKYIFPMNLQSRTQVQNPTHVGEAVDRLDAFTHTLPMKFIQNCALCCACAHDNGNKELHSLEQ